MLEVGTNSYVTVATADGYIAERYRPNNKGRKRWEETSEQDKEIILINACAELETLSYPGRKADHNQALSFPRLPQQYGKSQEPPQAIIFAQIELALFLSDESKIEQFNQRAELQAQGVKSFSIGDLSENYKDNADMPIALTCPKVARLLAPYLGGGYDIC